jgi:hypothetical protein
VLYVETQPPLQMLWQLRTDFACAPVSYSHLSLCGGRGAGGHGEDAGDDTRSRFSVMLRRDSFDGAGGSVTRTKRSRW